MVSLMNGLSSMGTGIASFAGTAGLEAQKEQLSEQGATLANQLAHTSATAEIAQRQAGQETITGMQSASAQAVAETGAEAQKAAAITQAGATLGAATTYADASRAVAAIQAATEPPEVKLLGALGVPLPGLSGGGSAAGASASPAAGSGGAGVGTAGASAPSGILNGTSAPGPSASGGASAAGTSPSGTPSPASTASPQTALTTNLINKALGLPMAGSDAANRYAIAQDVNNDPAFQYKSVGQKAAEVESRVAVAEGKMTDPGSRAAMAAGIASYQIAPLTNYALMKPGGPETMALVMKLNPDFQDTRYPEVSKVMAAFGSGKQGDIIRAENVGVQHLDAIDQAAKALGNGDVRALNSMDNFFKENFGSPAPTTFDGLKQLVGTEVEKAVAGGIGAASDRDRLMASLNRASSPEQLQGMTDGFRSLMVGQLIGLKQQYEDGTGFKTGPFAFDNKLVPATRQRIGTGNASQPAYTPTPGATGQPIGPAATPSVDEYGRPVPDFGARTQPAPAPAIPPWVRAGDQYSPSRGQARGADGALYGPPQ